MIAESRLVIEPFHRLEPSTEFSAYDLFIGTIGYEERSSHILRKYGRLSGRKRVCLVFRDNQVHHFAQNLQLAKELGVDVLEVWDDEIEAALSELTGVSRAELSDRPLRVLVDVSSMTRSMLARSVWWLRRYLPYGSVVDAVYSVASYTEGLVESGPVTESSALPHFAGWGGTPELELGLCIGLGFESHFALGAVEAHEPGLIWCFLPAGVDGRYDRKLAELNSVLLGEVSPSRIRCYDVYDPFRLCVELFDISTLAHGAFRLTFVPLGPKIFCLAAVAVSMAVGVRPGIWRVSSGLARFPVNRFANGKIVGLRLRLASVPEHERRSIWSLNSAEVAALI